MIKISKSDMEAGYFTAVFNRLLVDTSVKPLPVKFNNGLLRELYPYSLLKYLDVLYKVAGQNLNNLKHAEIDIVKNIVTPENNKILIAFSGGKDSVAAVIKAKKAGYRPILYHLKGINRSYTYEADYAELLARKLNAPIIFRHITITGRSDYHELPIKNQFILAGMVEYGIRNGIYRYAFGNQEKDVIKNLNIDYNLSDGIEMFDAIEKFFKSYIMNFELITFMYDETDSLVTVYNYDKGLFQDIVSCMTPLRYKQNLRKHNMQKYGVVLMEQNCGSCEKCAQRYLVISLLEEEKYLNVEYFKHCLDILRNKILKENDTWDNGMENIDMLEHYVDFNFILFTTKFIKNPTKERIVDRLEQLDII